MVEAQEDGPAATQPEPSSEELPANWLTNQQFFESTQAMQPSQLELALRQRISLSEEHLQAQRARYDELEAECDKAEEAGDDALYQETYAKWETVEANIARLEAELTECNGVMMEKYYQQRVATAQSGSRPTAGGRQTD